MRGSPLHALMAPSHDGFMKPHLRVSATLRRPARLAKRAPDHPPDAPATIGNRKRDQEYQTQRRPWLRTCNTSEKSGTGWLTGQYPTGAAWARPYAPNEAGVTNGHWHLARTTLRALTDLTSLNRTGFPGRTGQGPSHPAADVTSRRYTDARPI